MRNVWLVPWRAFIELACFLPILLPLSSATTGGHPVPVILMIYLLYHIGYGIGYLSLKIYMEWMIGMTVGIVATIMLMSLTQLAIPIAIVAATQTIRGIRANGAIWGRAFPIQAHFVFVFFYVLFPMLAQMYESFRVYSDLMWYAGLFTLAIFFYRLNRDHLDRANLNRSEGGRLPVNVLRINRIAIAALIALIVIIAKMDTLRGWLTTGWAYVWNLINKWLQRKPEEPMPLPPDAQGQDYSDMFGKVKEKSALWQLIERIAIDVIGYAFIILLVVGIVYGIVKVLIPSLRNWLDRINQQREEEGYIDETEKIDAPEWGRKLLGAFRRLAARPKPVPAGNGERVRRYFGEMVKEAQKDGYTYKPSYTPSETGMALERSGWGRWPVGSITKLYNRVRYGGAIVTDQEMSELEKEQEQERGKGRQ